MFFAFSWNLYFAPCTSLSISVLVYTVLFIVTIYFNSRWDNIFLTVLSNIFSHELCNSIFIFHKNSVEILFENILNFWVHFERVNFHSGQFNTVSSEGSDRVCLVYNLSPLPKIE